MKNILKKKKYVILLLTAILIFGSSRAFAAGNLFSNIINLVRNAFATKTESVLEATGNEMAQIGSGSSNDIKNYISDTYDQFLNDIEAYKNSEIARGKNEIDEYINEFKTQFDSAVTDEKGSIQQKITEKVDRDVDKIKKDLDKDIEKYIKDLSK